VTPENLLSVELTKFDCTMTPFAFERLLLNVFYFSTGFHFEFLLF